MGRLKRGSKDDYFEMFRLSARIAQRAAEALQKAFVNADVDMDEIRAIKGIEHEGDTHMHEALSQIERAFITPLDPEKMMDVLRGIEGLTDAIDQIAQYLYMMRIHKTDKYLDKFVLLLVEASNALVNLTNNLHDYKRQSAPLREWIVEINHLEDVGDQAYMQAMYELYDGQTEALDVLRFQSIYSQMENALDCCEDVADTIEAIIISAT